MKRILAILFSAACIAVFSASGDAAQWDFSGSGRSDAAAVEFATEPFAKILAIPSGDALEVFSSVSLAPFIPIQLDRFVISLLDVSPPEESFKTDTGLLPHLQLNTGIKTETSLTDPQSLVMNELLGNPADSFDVQSSVVFVGIGLDFDSGYLQGKAFVGRPMETLSSKLSSKKPPAGNQGLDTTAYGFEASAGYQLNNSVALSGGVGKMTDKNKETDQTEEVYAVYAQAILAVAPGVQVKPEVGQLERIKDKTEPEETDESFYAGAIWEVNF